jgi:hypothetical protein
MLVPSAQMLALGYRRRRLPHYQGQMKFVVLFATRIQLRSQPQKFTRLYYRGFHANFIASKQPNLPN